MSKYRTVLLAYKIAGIFLLTIAITVFSSGLVGNLRTEVNVLPLMMWLLTVGLLATLAFIFTFKSVLLVPRTLVDANPSEMTDSKSLAETQRVAFSIIGVALIGFAVPGAVRVVVIRFGTVSWERSLMTGGSLSTEEWAQLISSLIQIALGTGLFFGAATLSSWWYRLRNSAMS